MKTKLILATAASCLLVTACGVGPNMKTFTSGSESSKSAQAPLNSAESRFKLMSEEPNCPPPGDCCVAFEGTTHITIEGVTYNVEVNTSSGRIRLVEVGGGPDGFDAFFPILDTSCEIENGQLVGGTVTIAGATFDFDGTPIQDDHAQADTVSLTVDITGTSGLPFGAFTDATISTGQNIFIDGDCDGTPDDGPGGSVAP